MDRNTQDGFMAEFLDCQKKLLRQSRISLIMNIVLALALIAALAVLVPQARAELDHAEASLTEIDRLVADTEELVGGANEMIADTGAVTEAVQKLNEVDFETLNDAINNLNNAISPLSGLAGLFSK